MIHDLDASLSNLLKQEISYLDDNAISFETPEGESQPSGVAVNLFLYDVRENLELRSNEVRTERSNRTAIYRRAPVRVDCSYLITAWAGEIQDEHRILGDVMRVLLRYPKLPEAVLAGSLDDQELPLPTSVLQPGRLQSVGEFWQALEGRPRAALNYTVTVAVHPFEDTSVPLVVQTDVEANVVEPGENGL